MGNNIAYLCLTNPLVLVLYLKIGGKKLFSKKHCINNKNIKLLRFSTVNISIHIPKTV
jgi:hypothetical protein